eukprot:5657967-Karenia_brevis.AAC.1
MIFYSFALIFITNDIRDDDDDNHNIKNNNNTNNNFLSTDADHDNDADDDNFQVLDLSGKRNKSRTRFPHSDERFCRSFCSSVDCRRQLSKAVVYNIQRGHQHTA